MNNDELLELYNSGKTVKEIAVEKHASQTAVRNRIKKCIEKHRIEELTTLGKISKNIDIMQYIKDIEKGTSFDIALEKSGMTVSKFKRALYEKGGERGKTILIKRLEEEVPELPEIIEEYNKNTSLSNISEKLSMTSESISKAFNMYKFLTKDKDQNNKKQQDKETIQVIENNKKGEEHEL